MEKRTYLSVKTAAQLVEVSPRTIQNWAKDLGTKCLGRLFIDQAMLIQFLTDERNSIDKRLKAVKAAKNEFPS